MVQAYQEHYSVDDYRLWEGDWELIHGMPYAMPPSPSVKHQACAGNLLHEIKKAFEQHSPCGPCLALMETDWEVSSDTVVRPDLLVVCREPGERITRTPELVAEVVSASSVRRDEEMKFELYAREGVQWYLLLYPDQCLARIYRNRSGAFIKTADAGGEAVEFVLGECRFILDFSGVWV